MSENSGYLPQPKGFATKAVHSSINPDEWDCMCVIPPIVLSTTYKQLAPGKFKQYEYGRSGNPSRDVLERCLSTLEDAKYAAAFASGLGAITTLMSCYCQGDHVLIGDELYGGSTRLFSEIAKNYGIEATTVNTDDVNNVKRAIQPNTKLIFIESPTNPLLKVCDIKAIAEIAKKNGAHLAVDNTFLTPYFQRPLELGADFSVYSLTKYMNGHSDVVMGAVVTNNTEMYNKLRFLQNGMGIIPGPFDCALITRSLKTLPIRMKTHNANALIVAKFLESHPRVLKVVHPGLKSHPQHELMKRQTTGHSGMVSFYIDGGSKEAENFFKPLKLFTLAGSLGNCESLAEIPSLTSHASLSEETRLALKITDNLIRLSIGIEDVEDLVEDLKNGLDNM